jgi:hypothetical protein
MHYHKLTRTIEAFTPDANDSFLALVTSNISVNDRLALIGFSINSW